VPRDGSACRLPGTGGSYEPTVDVSVRAFSTTCLHAANSAFTSLFSVSLSMISFDFGLLFPLVQ